VAVTLVRNTEREIRYDLRSCTEVAARQVELSGDGQGDVQSVQPGVHGPSTLGLLPGGDTCRQVAAIREWLVAEIGRDSDLVIAVVLLGESQVAAAQRMGLSPEAVLKRLHRALKKLRKSVESEK